MGFYAFSAPTTYTVRSAATAIRHTLPTGLKAAVSDRLPKHTFATWQQAATTGRMPSPTFAGSSAHHLSTSKSAKSHTKVLIDTGREGTRGIAHRVNALPSSPSQGISHTAHHLFTYKSHTKGDTKVLTDTGREGTRHTVHRVNALPAVPTPSIPTPTVGAPEGLRGSLEGSVDIDSIDSLDSFDEASEFSQQAYDRFKQGYKSQYQELSFWVEDNAIEGTIPAELEGTLLRNGPGLLEIGGTALPQPLDGDGMVCKFAFKDGKVHFQNKYVRTEAMLKEQAAGKMLYRGVFSVGNPAGGKFFNPFNFTVKGVANTGVLHWGDRLLALYESDLPYQLDKDLKTIGTTTINRAIDTEKQRFGAHYRTVTEADGSRRLVAFNFEEQSKDGFVHFFEFDEGFNRIFKLQHKLPGGPFGFIHDILVTDQHYIVLENPIKMNFGKLLSKYVFAKACLAECLEYQADKSTKIHVIPRPGKQSSFLGQKPHAVYEIPPFFSFHHINAFEASGQQLVVDTVAIAGIDFSQSLDSGTSMFRQQTGRGCPTRLVINGKTGQVKQHSLVSDRACEFPSVAPMASGKPHKHAYLAGSRVTGETNWGPPQVVVKVTMPASLGTDKPFVQHEVKTEVWDAGPDHFAQEPIFCPRPDAEEEDDGWIFTMVYNACTDSTYLAILNAKNLKAGPVARIKLPHKIPYGLHGSFTKQYLAPTKAGEHHQYDIRNGIGSGFEPKYS